jgi:iduronate 2-sulfatase
VDDLKPALGSFGDPVGKTPNMDRLAAQGIRFTNHHVQVSECAPSRIALMTGRRPDQSLIFGREPFFRSKNRNAITLPAYFRNLGYTSIAQGKVFDISSFSDSKDFDYIIVEQCNPGTPKTATTCSFDDEKPTGILARDTNVCPLGSMQFPPFLTSSGVSFPIYGGTIQATSTNEQQFFDSCTIKHALRRLNQFAESGELFFLAVGILRPHMPWASPRRFWDVYPKAQEANLAKTVWARDIKSTAFFRTQASKASWRNYWDEWDFWLQGGKSPTNVQRPRAYYASVSFADDLVGKIVDAVENSPSKRLQENTVIVIWGDNGMHLGPALWGKKTVYEQATRTPLIVIPSVAWKRAQTGPIRGLGEAIAFPVETIDIYPTIVELANVQVPTFPLTGTSLVSYLREPNKKLKKAAVSQYRDQRDQYSQTQMGYSIRTENYRLVKYFQWYTGCYDNVRNCNLLDTPAVSAKPEMYYYAYPGAPETTNVYNNKAHKNARLYMESLMNLKSPSWAGLLTDANAARKMNNTTE